MKTKTKYQEMNISTFTEINTKSFTVNGIDGEKDYGLAALAGLELGKTTTPLGEVICQKYEDQPGIEARDITLQNQDWTARWRIHSDGELICYAEGASPEYMYTKWDDYQMGSQKDYDCAVENARKLAKALVQVNHLHSQLRHCPGH